MLPIGVVINNLERDRLKAFAVATEEGFQIVHTSAVAESWLDGKDRELYVAAARASGLTIHTMFVGFDGQSYADWPSIARTVGLVIPELREHRCQVALKYSDLAHELGVTSLAAHVGFLPQDPTSTEYIALIDVLRRIADRYGENGQTFRLETGQESAKELLRLIEAVNRPNVGVNLDVANFILYNTDDPLHALDRLGPYIWGVHCKDGIRPATPRTLGTEVPIGQGEVRFPELIRKLMALGYSGPLIIEREHGPQVREDVRAAREYLKGLMESIS